MHRMQDVNTLARKGIQVLIVRQVFLQVFTFAGGIVLARTLDPVDFGLFGITLFLVNLMALLGDFGLAPALIQRKQEITERDLYVGFTTQQLLVTAIVGIMWLSAPAMAALYPTVEQNEALVWLVRALAFNLYLTSWRSISVLQLERKLSYRRLAAVEVVESLSYQTVAVVLALWGYGVWSLIVAVLVRGGLGTLLAYRIAPWRIRFAFDAQVAWGIMRYGLPFQVHRAVGKIQGWVTPTIVAWLIGPEAVGFLMWASSNGRKPISIVQNVARVSLPHFSRLQDRPAEVERILGRYITGFLLLCGAWLAVLATAGTDLVTWIYTEKWLPAVTALILYAVVLNINAISWITKTALSGIGKVTFTMRVAVGTTLFGVALSIYLVTQIGFIGVPIAEAISKALMIPWLLFGLRRGALGRIVRTTAWVFIPLLGAMATGWFLAQWTGAISLRAVLTTLGALGVFSGLVWLTWPEAFRRPLMRQWHALRQRGKRGAAAAATPATRSEAEAAPSAETEPA